MYRCLLTILAVICAANASQFYGHLRPNLVGTHGLGSNVVLGGGNFVVNDLDLPGELVFQASGGQKPPVQGAGGSPAQGLSLQVLQGQDSSQLAGGPPAQGLGLQVLQVPYSQGVNLQALQGLLGPDVNPLTPTQSESVNPGIQFLDLQPLRVSSQGPLSTSQEPLSDGFGSPDSSQSQGVLHPKLPYTISKITTQVTSTVKLTVAVTSDFITPIHAARTTTLVQLLPSREYKSSKPETKTIIVNRYLTHVDTTTSTLSEPERFTVLAETPVLVQVTNTRTFVYSITHIHTTHVTKRDHTYTTVTLQLPPTETVTSTSVLVTTLYTTIVYPTVRH